MGVAKSYIDLIGAFNSKMSMYDVHVGPPELALVGAVQPQPTSKDALGMPHARAFSALDHVPN